MNVWEYAVFTDAPGDISGWLNEIGADGWELVAVTQYSFYFKRLRDGV